MRRTLVRLVAAALPLFASLSASAAPPVRIAVLPVVVHSLDEQDYLREGIGDMLTTRLGRSPHVEVVVIEDVGQATTDPAAAREAALALDAKYVLFGSFTRFGEGASLDLTCASTVNEEEIGGRSIFVQSGSIGEIIPRLDELTEKIVRYLADGPGATPAVSAAPPSDAAPNDELGELRARVERLEAVIYGSGESEAGQGAGAAPRTRPGDVAAEPEF